MSATDRVASGEPLPRSLPILETQFDRDAAEAFVIAIERDLLHKAEDVP